jgi:hypothetical protein
MNATEFFRDVAKSNYEEFESNPDDLRALWNAVVSMNTVPEYLALHRLNYKDVSRDDLYDAANEVRERSPTLMDLNDCAVTFKHVRKIEKSGKGKFEVTASSTGVSWDDRASWVIGSHDPTDVLRKSFETLSSAPEFK